MRVTTLYYTLKCWAHTNIHLYTHITNRIVNAIIVREHNITTIKFGVRADELGGVLRL